MYGFPFLLLTLQAQVISRSARQPHLAHAPPLQRDLATTEVVGAEAPIPSHPVRTGGVEDSEVGVAPLVLCEDSGVPECLEVLEDGSPVGCLVRATEELPDIVHPDGGGIILDKLLECIRHRCCPLCDHGLVLSSCNFLLGLGSDDEVALFVESKQASGGEVVDLDAGEALGVLVGSFEGGGGEIVHGLCTFWLVGV